MTRPGSFAAVGGRRGIEVPAAVTPPSTRPNGWRRPACTLPVVAMVLAAVLAVVLVDRGPGRPGAGEAIVQVDGTARVVRVGGAAATVTGSVRLEPGDRIALRAGTASFELARGVRYEGRGPAGRTAGTAVQMGTTPSLDAGSLLVTTDADPAALRAGSARAELGPGAAARVDRSLALRLGTYEGEAQLTSAGAKRDVPALRSADAVGDGELTGPEPLRVSARDRWDRRFLPDAVYLDGQLRPLAQGIEASRLAPADLLEAVRTRISARPSAASVAAVGRTRGVDVDLAIGLAVAGSANGGSFARRFGRGFSFHDDGATWGLVAMDLDAEPAVVLQAIRSALDSPLLADAFGRGSGPLASSAVDTSSTDAAVDATFGPGSVAGADGAAIGADAGGSTPFGTTPAGADPAGAVPGETVPGGATPGAGGAGAAPGQAPHGAGPVGPLPGSTGPGVTVPGVTVPQVPGVNVPGVTVPPVRVPPVTLPPVRLPPIILPPVASPPVALPPVVVSVPPVTLPPVRLPPVRLPPVRLPPVRLPPVVSPPVVVTAPPVALPPVALPPISTPPITVPSILGPVIGGVNGTLGGVTGTADGATGAVGGVTGTVGGLLGR